MLMIGGTQVVAERREDELNGTTREALAAASVATAILCRETMAKGLAATCRTLPAAMRRGLRQLDSAAALLKILVRPLGWRDTQRDLLKDGAGAEAVQQVAHEDDDRPTVDDGVEG